MNIIDVPATLKTTARGNTQITLSRDYGKLYAKETKQSDHNACKQLSVRSK